MSATPAERSLRVIRALLIVLVVSACAEMHHQDRALPDTQPLPSLAEGTLRSDLATGQRALRSGDLPLAKRAFAAAMRQAPNDLQVQIGQAETHLALGEVDAAGQLFDLIARGAGGASARVRQGQGLVDLRRGRFDRAVVLLGESVRLNERGWRAWLGLGQAHDRLGQPEAARRAFAAAERHAPVQAAVMNDIGMSYLTEKTPDRAAAFFEKALRIDPGLEVARANLRIAHAMTRRYDDAVAGATQTQLADVLNNVGYVAILNGDFTVADRLLRQALEVSPVYHRAASANLDLLGRVSRDAVAGTDRGPRQAQRTLSRPTNAPDAREAARVATAPARLPRDTAPRPAPKRSERPALIEDLGAPDQKGDAPALPAETLAAREFPAPPPEPPQNTFRWDRGPAPVAQAHDPEEPALESDGVIETADLPPQGGPERPFRSGDVRKNRDSVADAERAPRDAQERQFTWEGAVASRDDAPAAASAPQDTAARQFIWEGAGGNLDGAAKTDNTGPSARRAKEEGVTPETSKPPRQAQQNPATLAGSQTANLAGMPEPRERATPASSRARLSEDGFVWSD